MPSSDSMFLFEVIVEKFKSFVDSEDVSLKVEFKDIFEMLFEHLQVISKTSKIKLRKRSISSKTIARKVSTTKCQTAQSRLITMTPQELLRRMYSNDLELSLWNRNMSHKVGISNISWDKKYLNCVTEFVENKSCLPAVSVRAWYKIRNYSNNRKIATVKLNISLTFIEDKSINNTLPTFINKTKSIVSNDNFVINTMNIHNATNKSKNYNCLTSILSENVVEDNITKTDNLEHNETVTKSQSFSMINQKHYNPFKHVFGDLNRTKLNKIYCVNYCTVENNLSNKTSKSSLKISEKSSVSKTKFGIKICHSECKVMKNRNDSWPASTCSLDIPNEATSLISVVKCKQIVCDSKEHRVRPLSPDDRIFLDLLSSNKVCCESNEINETLEGDIKTNVKIGNDPCYCSCECTFGFTKKTTYCKVCGGYEMVGEEKFGKQITEIFPCPYYHKLIDKNKMKTLSTSGSESKKRGDNVSIKAMKAASNQKAASEKRTLGVSEKKSIESEQDSLKNKKKKNIDKFKFNYGYKAPQIGHSRCALPCTGTMNNVPKKMGWMWTADNIPGMKFRPGWKPGATNKHVVRLLRMAKNPGETLLPKKKRKDAAKKKPLIRPLLTVHKKDGEFTVTMETMKNFTKLRALNQYPYEDKPVLTYTIGRTEEENKDRKKKKEREQRRLERAQRQFIQSTFRDMCREICLKTYQQALGILPDAEDPECTCYPALPGADRTNLNLSCSCSDDESSVGSDTDSDEWIVEFTPPCATFRPFLKNKKVLKVDNSTQYTYLDYRVKLIDRFGNPVPRYFKGPDGKQQCSDLGGFWGPDKKWLTINVDGYIAPDGRWAPNYFIGPGGENVEAITGKFQTSNNNWLIVGVDGYVDTQGRWKFYPKPKEAQLKRKRQNLKVIGAGAGDRQNKHDIVLHQSEASWSCLGSVSAKDLSQLGIVGHGHDKKLLLSTLRDMLTRGENVKIPQPSTVFRLPSSKKRREKSQAKRSRSCYEERNKCKHSSPSDKGIIAVDDLGNKTYFRLKNYKNVRPKERIADLTSRGISLSSFHVPCFHSFISSEVMKREQQARFLALSAKSVATQI